MRCESLHPHLELYAEGELHDRAAVASLERHLTSCRHCTNYLLEYDELTASLLAVEVTQGDPAPRVERIGAALSALPRRSPTIRAPRLVLEVPPPALASQQSRRWPWFLGAAAALFLLGIALGLLLSRDEHMPAEVASGEGILRLLEAQSAIAEEAQGRSRRWVLDENFLADFASRRPSERLLRLYGLDLFDGDAPRTEEASQESSQSGFVVDALPRVGDRITRSARFYLVTDNASGASAEVIEIDPRSWFQAHDLSAIRRQARQGRSKLYRVLAVPAQKSLLDFGMPAEIEPRPLSSSLPGAWRDKLRGKDWGVPVQW